MKYILFEAGPVTVYSYGLMIALGVILTFVVAQKRAKNYGLDPDAIFYMGAWGLHLCKDKEDRYFGLL